MKILYNVTVIVDNSVLEEWKTWMIDIHIPEVMETGAFESYSMQRVLTAGSEGGSTFAIQYLSASQEEYDRYQMQYAPLLQEKHETKYKGKYGAFRTVMEVVKAG